MSIHNKQLIPVLDNTGDWKTLVRGMTLREYYAGLAMQGFLSTETGNSFKRELIAKWSVECADAIIAELEKETAE